MPILMVKMRENPHTRLGNARSEDGFTLVELFVGPPARLSLDITATGPYAAGVNSHVTMEGSG